MIPRRVSVVGGGIIGLSIAWECARRGHEVTVYDPDPGSGASHVAAGMLAPVGESYFGEQELTELLLESARRWPAYARELAAASGHELGHRTEGTLQVGLTADDLAQLRRLWTHQRELGTPVVTLDSDQLREREPLLHPRARGVLVESDHQIDPRKVVAALRSLVPVRRAAVASLADLDTAADTVVLAAGCASAELAGLPVRPVQGTIVRLRGPVVLRHVIRGYADGRAVYLVPRADGEVLVGATVEERADGHATAGGIRDLLRAATDLVPELGEHALVEVSTGHRPGTEDNGPIVGELEPAGASPRLLVATGHYRHGVLAAPYTAHAVADLVDGRALPLLWAPFTPQRLSAGGAR
ncbi:glycine oxidase ThiO [Catellatospora sp. TT07R-123]|uniref:glycine oxidase ThiO n=1 Tax=Catellatospora sp. TT07R-123 TaxID=2733863 RepID=UPI001B0C5E8A|nr:glycine oxidase ThiO [Catellatospora sp. TT07R-123]GHJ46129.1 glycine oxidase ThiO [Catellatospora sp. TT07R-123]